MAIQLSPDHCTPIFTHLLALVNAIDQLFAIDPNLLTVPGLN